MKSLSISKNSEQDDLDSPTCTALIHEEDCSMDTNQVEKCETSPAVSRYGRTHKPKISEDFLPTDKKVGAILGLSPKSRQSLSRDGSLSILSRNKALEKGRVVRELLKDENHTPTRGRKPKLKQTDSNPSEKKLEPDDNELHCLKTDDIKSEVSTSEKVIDSDKVEIKIEKESPRKGGNEAENEIMSPDVTSSVDDNILSENLLENLSKPSTISVNCGWVPGDLAWARVGGHPFWPCMVAVDQRTGVYTKVKRVGRGLTTIQRSLHVQFFGDNGRHSWVSTNCVIKFEGKDGLQDFADKVLSEIKKKDKKYSTAFVIRPSSKVQWDCAVQEAEEAFPKTNQERIRFFEENFPPEMHLDEPIKKENASVDEERGNKQTRLLKRKRNDVTGEKPLKQIKLDLGSNSDKIKEENDTSENGAVQVITRSKQKKKKRVKKEPYDFRIFADKYSKHAAEIHPGMNNESLQKLMIRMWAAMDESEKSVYKREGRDSSESSTSSSSSSADEDASDDQGNDDNSSNGTRESTPSFALSNTPLKKANGLFRGTRSEKVCQICLKPGNTVKCKGLCHGTFHVGCLKYPPVKEEPTEMEVKRRRGRLPKTLKNENGITESEENHSNDSGNEKDCKMDIVTNENEKEENDKNENKVNKYEDEIDNGEFRCKDCSENRTPVCFECNSEKDPKTESDVRVRCINGHCGKFYHLECVKAWPQASSNGSSKKQMNGNKNGMTPEGTKNQVMTCPQHVCHTCASDDPRNATMRFNHERLVRCVQCPTAYHTGNYCIPAGTEILTGSQIICPRHYEPPVKGNHHVNASWCFICAMVGGSLICCDLCPTSFHAECLKIAPPEGGYICEDCDTGRYPLYGEVVWVKLGAYRWWPAQILFPNQIPDNVANLPHKLGEFAVRFFGSHDHYWVNRGRVFLYQEGDTGHKSAKKTSVDGLFQKALAEAAEAHKKIKVDRSLREAEARPGMKPPSYIRIKTNKPVGNVRVYEVDPSSMTPCECDPDSKNPCGVDSDCLNRILMVECTPGVCAAGDRCGNQCFLKREYPPLEPFRTESRGWGLRALKNLRKGEFVIEYVGEMIDEAEYRRRLDCKHQEKDENYYFLTIDNHRLLDAGPKGNVARFMNHSCQPNCETQKWTVNGDTRVGLFALQDVPMGEELTFNYNLECVGPDKKPCMCGAPNCSGYIGVKVSKLIEDEKKAKLGKQENQRSAKKKKKRQLIKLTEGDCFECGGGGELLLCDNKTCPKGYHLSCAKQKTWPKGKWLCPWHSCDICLRRTGKRCGFCPRSYCGLHAEGNIRLNSTLGMVCRKHDEDPDKSTSEAYNQILEDVEICLKGIRRDNDNVDAAQNDVLNSKENVSELQENTTSEIKQNNNTKNEELPEGSDKSAIRFVSSSGLKELDTCSQVTLQTPNEPSTLCVNSSVAPKKRGRPRKYPLSPPTLAQYKSPKASETTVPKTPNFTPKSVDVSTVKKKKGRPRKYPLPDSPRKDSISQSEGTSVMVISPQTVVQKNGVTEDEYDEKLNSSEPSMIIEAKNVSVNSMSCRTSNRKRQPSEKLAAFMNSQCKSAKKQLKKSLETFVTRLERNQNVDSIYSDASNGFSSASHEAPSTTRDKGSTKKVEKTGGNKMDKNHISGTNKNHINKSRKNNSCKSVPTLTKSHKAKVIKSTKISDFFVTKPGKVLPIKMGKNLQCNSEKNIGSKTSKNNSNTKASKDDSAFKSYLKKTPKKTILQRVDHKPDLGKFSIDYKQKTQSPSLINGSFASKGNASSGSPSKNNVGNGVNNDSLYQKAGVNGTNDISANSSILESFDDNESQYFSENVTTIPIKFSEFGQMKDEFLVGSDTPEEEVVENVVNLDSEFIARPSEESTEKLSEDGKYQILTNMRPDSLGIEKQVLMGVES